MSDNKILSEDELRNISGGLLSSEAQSWYSRNFDAIYSRVAAISAYGDFSMIMEVYIMQDTRQYTVSEVKDLLKKKVGINVDDLN